MEIPIINRMTQLEPTMNSLTNPPLIRRLISIFKLAETSSTHHRIWKWGALFLALAYALSNLAYKLKFVILYYHNKSKSLLLAEPLLSHSDLDDDVRSDDEDDVSVADDDEDVDVPTPGSSYEDLKRFGDDFRVKGSFHNFGESRGQNCNFKFTLSDLVNGNGVVKLWENSILGELEFPTVSVAPSVILTAAGGEDGVLGLGLWDLRMNRRSEAIKCEWRSDWMCRPVRVASGRTGKVYVGDDVGMRVGDVRKLDTPLGDLTTFEEKKWW